MSVIHGLSVVSVRRVVGSLQQDRRVSLHTGFPYSFRAAAPMVRVLKIREVAGNSLDGAL